MALPGMSGGSNRKKEQENEEQKAKRYAEQKLWEQHAADMYLKMEYGYRAQEEAKDRWRQVSGDPELAPIEDKAQQPGGAGSIARLEEEPSLATLLLVKDGTYENKKGAQVYVYEGKIYPRSGATMEDAVDFALTSRGALTQGIEYDVGSLTTKNSDVDLSNPTQAARVQAFREYKSRLKEIEAIQTKAQQHGPNKNQTVDVFLSENTKNYLARLLSFKLIDENKYHSILNEDRIIGIKARATTNQLLVNNITKEIDIIRGKGANSIQAGNFTLSNNNDIKKISDNLKNEFERIDIEMKLLEKAIKLAEHQVNGLDRDFTMQAELAAKNDPFAERLGNELTDIRNNWTKESGMVKLLGDANNPSDAKRAMEALFARLEEMKRLLEAQLEEGNTLKQELSGLNQVKRNAETKSRSAEAQAKELQSLVDKYNAKITNPTDKIDLQTISLTDLNTKLALDDSPGKALITQETLDFQKATPVALIELHDRIQAYNKANPAADKIIDLNTMTVVDPAILAAVNTKLSTLPDHKTVEEKTLQDLKDRKDDFDPAHTNYKLVLRKEIANADQAIKAFENNAEKQAKLKNNTQLTEQIKKITDKQGKSSEGSQPATGLKLQMETEQKKIDDAAIARTNAAIKMENLRAEKRNQAQQAP